MGTVGQGKLTRIEPLHPAFGVYCASPRARAGKHLEALHIGAAGYKTCITNCVVFILDVLGDSVAHVFQQKCHNN